MQYTEKEIEDLVDAVWLVLDDMGKDSRSVSPYAKAWLRVAFEPFVDDLEMDVSFEEAQNIVDDTLGIK